MRESVEPEHVPQAPSGAAGTPPPSHGRGGAGAAVFPGSFDPFHRGHLDLVRRAAAVFGSVVVAVAPNHSKRTMFDVGRRVDIVRESCAGIAGVLVEVMDQPLVAEFCRSRGAVLVKGLRSGQDFAYESPMATMNRQLAAVETLYLQTAPEWAHVSSSMMKEVHGLGGDISALVPPAALREMMRG